MSQGKPSDFVVMERPNLDGIPQIPLPEPCRIRTYQPGDEANWYDIHIEADEISEITKELFVAQFGSDREELSTRQFYLCDGEHVVGTASAWYDANYKDGSYGRVHWVAIRPRWQGRGLSKPLLAEVLRTLKKLGHKRAYLTTLRRRPVAINLYKALGFVEV